MKNIIEERWNGEINPHYKELQHLQSRNKAELLESLSEEQKEKLEKYCDTTFEMNSVSEREAFASRFRIALRLAAEGRQKHYATQTANKRNTARRWFAGRLLFVKKREYFLLTA